VIDGSNAFADWWLVHDGNNLLKNNNDIADNRQHF